MAGATQSRPSGKALHVQRAAQQTQRVRNPVPCHSDLNVLHFERLFPIGESSQCQNETPLALEQTEFLPTKGQN